MCKIAIIPGLKDENTELAWKFVRKLAKEMTGYSDDDGFGYAAIDGNGQLFGERWFNPKEAFLNREEKAILSEQMIKKFKGFVRGQMSVYNRFGEVHDKSLRSIMLHARNATNEKSLRNTHPFVAEGTALIHNGVIQNDEELIKKISTCDSEVILNEYLRLNVVNKAEKIDDVAARLDGYYAVGVLARQKNGRNILDVFKDDGTRLKGYFIKEFNTLVFATPGANEDYGPIQTACKDLNLTIVTTLEIEDGVLVRMDAMTGEVIGTQKFDIEFRDKSVAKKSSTAAGNHGPNTDRRQGNGNNGVQEGFNHLFRTGEHSNRSQRSLAERQKDEELERELIDGISYSGAYEESGQVNKDTPPVEALPEGASTQFNIDDDWQETDDGVWYRRRSDKAV